MTYCLRQGAVLPLLFAISLLSACGFQLRGQMDINSDLAALSVSGNDQSYTRELTRALQSSGIQVNDNAPYRVNILKVVQTTGDRALLTAGRYEQRLSLQVTYQLEMQDKLPLFTPVTLETERYISLDQNQTNAAQSEEQLVFQELRQSLIMQNVQRIAGISEEALKVEEERVRSVEAQTQKQEQQASRS